MAACSTPTDVHTEENTSTESAKSVTKATRAQDEYITVSNNFLSEELCKLSLEESAIANKVKLLKRSNEQLKMQLLNPKQLSISPPPCPPASDAEEDDLDMALVPFRSRFCGCCVRSVQSDCLPRFVTSESQTLNEEVDGNQASKASQADGTRITDTTTTDSRCQNKLKQGEAHKSEDSCGEESPLVRKKWSNTRSFHKVCQRRSADDRLNHLLHVTQLQNSQIERLMMKATETQKYKRKASKLQQRNTALLAKLQRRDHKVRLQHEVINLLKKEFYYVLRKVDKIQVLLGKQQVLSNGECDVISRFVMARHCHVRDKLDEINANAGHDISAASVAHADVLPPCLDKKVDMSLNTPHLGALLEQSLSATDRNHQQLLAHSTQRRLLETGDGVARLKNNRDEVTEEEVTDLPSLWEESRQKSA